MNNEDDQMQALQDDVVRQRRAVQDDLHALNHKLSPARAAQELKTEFVAGARESVRKNPVPAILIGAGVGYFVYDAYTRGRDHSRGTPGESFNQNRDRSSQRDRVASKWNEVKGEVQDRVEGAVDSARSRGSELADRAKMKAEVVRDRAGAQAERAQSQTEDLFARNPLAFAGACFAAGIGISLLAPSSRKEDELMGPYRDELVDRGKEEADRAKQVATHAVESAVQEARGEAESRGLDAQSLKGKAKEMGSDAKQALKSGGRAATREVKDEYSGPPRAELRGNGIGDNGKSSAEHGWPSR